MRTGEPYWGARTRAKKIFEKKLDNFKNLCYNKYVRLRGKQTPRAGVVERQTPGIQNPLLIACEFESRRPHVAR